MRTPIRRSRRPSLSATIAPSAVSELRARLRDAGRVPKAALGASLGLLLAATPPAQGQSVVLTGDVNPTQPATPLWDVGGVLTIGDSGAGTLTVKDGGSVSNSIGYLGLDSGSTGAATITGAGSSWTNSGLLSVGNFGQGTLNVEAGGRVSSAGGVIRNTGSIATVTGAGSAWINSGELEIDGRSEAVLRISDGGSVSNTSAYIARGDYSRGGVTVTGAGSTWTNSGNLHLGYGAFARGSLLVEDGGGVSNANSFILGSDITVTGAGSTWTNNGDLHIYLGGNLNVTHGASMSARKLTFGSGHGALQTIRIEDGGSVTGTTTSLGNASTAIVAGAGSSWTSSGEFFVGHDGPGSLTVAAGAIVSNTNGYIGHGNGATAAATVTGAGSTWTNNGHLSIGQASSNPGVLNIEAGGRVSSAGGWINISGSTTVTGAGSTWINSGQLEINSDSETALRISDGGSVSNTSVSIASMVSSQVAITVTGAGSTWTNNGQLSIGTGTWSRGTLLVEDGGRVSNTNATIISSNITVTGTGSTWTNNGDLHMYLGDSLNVTHGGSMSAHKLTFGSGHNRATTMNIEDGGSVASISGRLEYTSTAIVTGAGSTWTNTGDLILGGSSLTTATGGTGTLNILDGGLVNVGGTIKPHAGGTINYAGGTINLDGGTLGTGSLDLTTGTLNHRDGTLRINGGVYSQAPGALVLSGDTASAKPRLELLDGATTTGIEAVTIGDLADRQGELLVSGGGVLTSSGQITLGNHGTGTLNIGAYDRGDTAGTVTATRITTGSGGGTINFNQTDAITFSVPISGNISLHQRGSGVTILDGDYTYTGITTVSDGALLMNGSLANTSVKVTDGGTLGGTGAITKITLDEGARLTPGGEIGVSVGTLSADSLTWQPGARLVFDLGPATSDLLDLGGAFTKTGFSDYLFDFVDAGWQAGQTYTLVHFSATNFTAGDFGFTNGNGFDGVFGLTHGSLTFHVTTVPEPSATAALAGLGVLGIVACRRRRRRAG